MENGEHVDYKQRKTSNNENMEDTKDDKSNNLSNLNVIEPDPPSLLQKENIYILGRGRQTRKRASSHEIVKLCERDDCTLSELLTESPEIIGNNGRKSAIYKVDRDACLLASEQSYIEGRRPWENHLIKDNKCIPMQGVPDNLYNFEELMTRNDCGSALLGSSYITKSKRVSQSNVIGRLENVCQTSVPIVESQANEDVESALDFCVKEVPGSFEHSQPFRISELTQGQSPIYSKPFGAKLLYRGLENMSHIKSKSNVPSILSEMPQANNNFLHSIKLRTRPTGKLDTKPSKSYSDTTHTESNFSNNYLLKKRTKDIDKDYDERLQGRKNCQNNNFDSLSNDSALGEKALSLYQENVRTIAEQFENYPKAPGEQSELNRCYDELYLDQSQNPWDREDNDGIDSEAKNGHLLKLTIHENPSFNDADVESCKRKFQDSKDKKDSKVSKENAKDADHDYAIPMENLLDRDQGDGAARHFTCNEYTNKNEHHSQQTEASSGIETKSNDFFRSRRRKTSGVNGYRNESKNGKHNRKEPPCNRRNKSTKDDAKCASCHSGLTIENVRQATDPNYDYAQVACLFSRINSWMKNDITTPVSNSYKDYSPMQTVQNADNVASELHRNSRSKSLDNRAMYRVKNMSFDQSENRASFDDALTDEEKKQVMKKMVREASKQLSSEVNKIIQQKRKLKKKLYSNCSGHSDSETTDGLSADKKVLRQKMKRRGRKSKGMIFDCNVNDQTYHGKGKNLSIPKVLVIGDSSGAIPLLKAIAENDRKRIENRSLPKDTEMVLSNSEMRQLDKDLIREASKKQSIEVSRMVKQRELKIKEGDGLKRKKKRKNKGNENVPKIDCQRYITEIPTMQLDPRYYNKYSESMYKMEHERPNSSEEEYGYFIEKKKGPLSKKDLGYFDDPKKALKKRLKELSPADTAFQKHEDDLESKYSLYRAGKLLYETFEPDVRVNVKSKRKQRASLSVDKGNSETEQSSLSCDKDNLEVEQSISKQPSKLQVGDKILLGQEVGLSKLDDAGFCSESMQKISHLDIPKKSTNKQSKTPSVSKSSKTDTSSSSSSEGDKKKLKRKKRKPKRIVLVKRNPTLKKKSSATSVSSNSSCISIRSGKFVNGTNQRQRSCNRKNKKSKKKAKRSSSVPNTNCPSQDMLNEMKKESWAREPTKPGQLGRSTSPHSLSDKSQFLRHTGQDDKIGDSLYDGNDKYMFRGLVHGLSQDRSVTNRSRWADDNIREKKEKKNQNDPYKTDSPKLKNLSFSRRIKEKERHQVSPKRESLAHNFSKSPSSKKKIRSDDKHTDLEESTDIATNFANLFMALDKAQDQLALHSSEMQKQNKICVALRKNLHMNTNQDEEGNIYLVVDTKRLATKFIQPFLDPEMDIRLGKMEGTDNLYPVTKSRQHILNVLATKFGQRRNTRSDTNSHIAAREKSGAVSPISKSKSRITSPRHGDSSWRYIEKRRNRGHPYKRNGPECDIAQEKDVYGLSMGEKRPRLSRSCSRIELCSCSSTKASQSVAKTAENQPQVLISDESYQTTRIMPAFQEQLPSTRRNYTERSASSLRQKKSLMDNDQSLSIERTFLSSNGKWNKHHSKRKVSSFEAYLESKTKNGKGKAGENCKMKSTIPYNLMSLDKAVKLLVMKRESSKQLDDSRAYSENISMQRNKKSERPAKKIKKSDQIHKLNKSFLTLLRSNNTHTHKPLYEKLSKSDTFDDVCCPEMLTSNSNTGIESITMGLQRTDSQNITKPLKVKSLKKSRLSPGSNNGKHSKSQASPVLTTANGKKTELSPTQSPILKSTNRQKMKSSPNLNWDPASTNDNKSKSSPTQSPMPASSKKKRTKASHALRLNHTNTNSKNSKLSQTQSMIVRSPSRNTIKSSPTLCLSPDSNIDKKSRRSLTQIPLSSNRKNASLRLSSSKRSIQTKEFLLAKNKTQTAKYPTNCVSQNFEVSKEDSEFSFSKMRSRGMFEDFVQDNKPFNLENCNASFDKKSFCVPQTLNQECLSDLKSSIHECMPLSSWDQSSPLQLSPPYFPNINLPRSSSSSNGMSPPYHGGFSHCQNRDDDLDDIVRSHKSGILRHEYARWGSTHRSTGGEGGCIDGIGEENEDDEDGDDDDDDDYNDDSDDDGDGDDEDDVLNECSIGIDEDHDNNSDGFPGCYNSRGIGDRYKLCRTDDNIGILPDVVNLVNYSCSEKDEERNNVCNAVKDEDDDNTNDLYNGGGDNSGEDEENDDDDDDDDEDDDDEDGEDDVDDCDVEEDVADHRAFADLFVDDLTGNKNVTFLDKFEDVDVVVVVDDDNDDNDDDGGGDNDDGDDDNEYDDDYDDDNDDDNDDYDDDDDNDGDDDDDDYDDDDDDDDDNDDEMKENCKKYDNDAGFEKDKTNTDTSQRDDKDDDSHKHNNKKNNDGDADLGVFLGLCSNVDKSCNDTISDALEVSNTCNQLRNSSSSSNTCDEDDMERKYDGHCRGKYGENENEDEGDESDDVDRDEDDEEDEEEDEVDEEDEEKEENEEEEKEDIEGDNDEDDDQEDSSNEESSK